MRAYIVGLCALFLLLCAPPLTAQKNFPGTGIGRLLFRETGDNEYTFRFNSSGKQGKENPRLVAAVLDVSLGLFGMHRLYLGTDVKVPVFYTLTIGGGCVLWIVDLGLILFTRDLTPYMDNPNLFMWVPYSGPDEKGVN